MADRKKESSNFQYKCRRCGEVDDSTGTNGLNAMNILMSLVFDMMMPPPFDKNALTPKMLDMHSCKDGGAGVSDLIGITNSGSNR